MKKYTVRLSNAVATGIGLALGKKLSTEESPARMAWIVLQLRKVKDHEEWFPRGKWATIQAIEQQLDDIAIAQVRHKGILG